MNKIYSVSEISKSLKSLIENNFTYVEIIGEVSNLKKTASNHTYLNLKDEVNVLFCTIWSFNKNKIPISLKEGDKIIAKGKITAYGGGSRYQLNILGIQLEGSGNLLQELEKLKTKLKDFFVQNRPIKKYPTSIGIVTSSTGAVIQDILHRIEERYPIKIILSPTIVQGKTAAQDICRAIEKLQDKNIDTIIVARGGGSIEDLWCFNDENLVKTIFKSKIPIISAIGHETDFTLCDFASDLRAPTPTAAAEISTPHKSNILENIKLIKNKIINHFKFKIDYQTKHLNIIENDIKYNSPILNIIQKLDIIKEKFKNISITNEIKTKASHFQYLSNQIFNYYFHTIKDIKNKIENKFNHEIYKIDNTISKPQSDILSFIKKNKISYITNINNKTISSVKDVPDKMYINFIDGKIKVKKDLL